MMMTIIHCADGWMETSTESTFDYTGDYNGQLLLCALNGEEPGGVEALNAPLRGGAEHLGSGIERPWNWNIDD